MRREDLAAKLTDELGASFTSPQLVLPVMREQRYGVLSGYPRPHSGALA
jgi:hypothetical protein